MAYDALLSSTGPIGVPGNPIEAGNVTVDAGGTKGWVYFGTYREGVAVVRVSGAFDRTTGNETLAVLIQEATDAAGTSAATLAVGPTMTATHAANLGSSTANGKVAGTLSDGPVRIGFMTGAGGWIRAYYDAEGTTPIVAGVSVDFMAGSGAFRASGT